jgi:hypothetical protein
LLLQCVAARDLACDASLRGILLRGVPARDVAAPDVAACGIVQHDLLRITVVIRLFEKAAGFYPAVPYHYPTHAASFHRHMPPGSTRRF